MAKDPIAVELGRRGGKARLKRMSKEQRSAVAKLGAQKRWANFREEMDRLNQQVRAANKQIRKIERRAKKKSVAS